MSELARVEQGQGVVATSQTQAIVSVIERAMMNPEVDIDKMERIMAMQERILDRQAEQAYFAGLAKCQSEMEAVVKNKMNTHTKSGYADLQAIHKQIKPIYTKHGFAVSASPYMVERETRIGVRLEVTHEGGHKKVFEGPFPLDVAGSQGKANKTPLQGMGSTFTYARRYLELMAFNISISEDNDGNSTAPTPERTGDIESAFANAKTVQELVKVMNGLKPDEKKAFKAQFDARRNELSGAQ